MTVAEGVKARLLVVVVLAAPNAAVTPAGTPERVRFTLPLRPARLPTVMVSLTLAPPTSAVRLGAEAVRLKLGVGTTRVIAAELLAVAEIPFTMTV